MSPVEGLVLIGGIAGALVAIAAFVRSYYPPTRRIVRKIDTLVDEVRAVRQVAEVQLTANGGTTMTDKVAEMHREMPGIKAALANISAAVAAVEKRQLERGEEMDQMHADNVERLDRLEVGHSETTHRLDRMEMRQEYGQKLLGLMVPGLAESAQEQVRKLLTDDPPPGGAEEVGKGGQ